MNPFPGGAGSPCAERSGTETRRRAADTGFMTRSGARFSAIPKSWLGTPRVVLRTMLGGVRTDRSTRAPASARSTAISAAELPAPTTSTFRLRYGAGSRYSDECTSTPRKLSLPGHSGMTGTRL